MLVFINNASKNQFVVMNTTNKIVHLTNPEQKALLKFQEVLGGLDYLTLPDLTAVNTFRKLVSTGILANVPWSDTKDFLLSQYPEYFI